MLKLRLQRTGRKKKPTYRVIVIEHSKKRNGKPVEYLGYYSPLTKKFLRLPFLNYFDSLI